MAIHELDAILENLGEQSQANAGQQPRSPVDDAISRVVGRQEQQTKTALIGADKTTPDRAAEILRLSRELQIPTAVVERNFDEVSRRSRLIDVPALQRRAPTLVDWLGDPDNAAVAKDDVPALEKVEKTLSFMESIARGVDVAQGMFYGFVEASGELMTQGAGFLALHGAPTRVIGEKLRDYGRAGRIGEEAEIRAGKVRTTTADIKGPWDLIQWAKETVGEQIPIMAPVLAGGIGGGAAGTATGIPGGTVVGAIIGAFVPSLVLSTGEVQGAIKEKNPDAETPLTAFIGGSGIAALDSVLPGRIGGRLARTFGHEAAEKIAQRALMAPVKPKYLNQVTGGMATEALTEAVQEAIGEVSAAVGTGTSTNWAELGAAMREAAAAGALMGGATTIPETTLERGRIGALMREAEQQQAVFETLAEGVKESKLYQRLPEKAQEFVDRATKDGPISTLFVPVESWTLYWQERGVDPAHAATQVLGDEKAYEQALAAGHALQIPTGAYAARLAATEHHAFFRNEIRFRADGLSPREAVEVREAMAAAAELQKGDAPAGEASITGDLQEQLLAAGVEEGAAKSYVALYESVFKTLATRSGLDPAALYEAFGLRVRRPDISVSLTRDGGQQGTPTQGRLDEAGAREERPPSDSTGEGSRGGDDARLAPRRIDEIPASFRADFLERILPDARVRGFAGTDEDLAALYIDRIEDAKALVDELAAEDTATDPTKLLQAISRVGGISTHAESRGGVLTGVLGEIDALQGEIRGATFQRTLQSKFRKGEKGPLQFTLEARLQGLDGPIITRRAPIAKAQRDFARTHGKGKAKKVPLPGKSLDDLFQTLTEEEGFKFGDDGDVGTLADMIEAIRDAILDYQDGTAKGRNQKIIDALERALYVVPGEDWWADTILHQGEEQADLLDTGEQQPRLPDAGDVRDVENETPEFDLPFSLTSEVAKGSKGNQGSLFQGPVGIRTTDLKAFRDWFAASHVVDENGDPLVVFHGTQRLDRFGPRLKPSRATSGPMPFFTDDPEIASNYAKNKQDTSLPDDEHYKDWFRMRVGDKRTKPVDIERAWYFLSADERRNIAELAPRVGQDDEATEIVLHPEGHKSGLGGYVGRAERHRGNHLAALVEEWLTSGALFNDEQAFFRVLELAGVPVERIEYHDPAMTRSGVLPVYLSIQNPLDTMAIPEAVFDALEQRAKRTRTKPRVGADTWDKASQDAREWIEMLRKDREGGANSYAWTSIPDWVTSTLEGLGYDGIRDTGGKAGGVGHTVWIPFKPTQVKSAIANRGTFDPTSGNMLYQQGILTPEAVKDWVLSIRQEFPELSLFDVELTRDGHLFLDMIAVKKEARKQGIGTKVMERLVAFADSHQRMIGLSPATRNATFGTTSRRRLIRFYRGHGFVENKGRSKDYSLSRSFKMIRKPRAPRQQLYQSAATFYSKVRLVVDEATTQRATGAQWKATVKNAKIGVSPHEIALTEIGDLDDARKYTKAEVLAYLDERTIKVHEITLGSELPGYEARERELIDARIVEILDDSDDLQPTTFEWEARYNEDDGHWHGYTGLKSDIMQDIGEFFRTEAEALVAAERTARIETENELEEFRGQAERLVDMAAVRRQLREEGFSTPSPKYETLTVQQGARTNYREIFLTADDAVVRRLTPGSAYGWKDGHEAYDAIDNPIVRIRLNERKVGGGLTVFLEEVQPPHPTMQAKMPAAFRDNWREIAMKYAVRYAADRGATHLAWTTGQQQRERYKLSVHVERIEAGPWEIPQWKHFRLPQGMKWRHVGLKRRFQGATRKTQWMSFAVGENGRIIDADRETWAGKDLVEVVGSGLAEQIMDTTRENVVIEGEGLDIGGLGLARLYDVDLPKVVQKIPAVKRAGAKLTTVDIGDFREEWALEYDIPMQARRAVGADTAILAFPTQAKAEEFLAASNVKEMNPRIYSRRVGSDPTIVPAIEITPEVRAAVQGGQPLLQEKRGVLRWGPDRQFNIDLLPRADLSTFLHESGHFYLEVLGDVVDVIRGLDPNEWTPEQRTMVDDYTAILRWLGVTDRAGIGTPQHEQFARGFEAYAMEGKSPSVELRTAFARFRAWLLGVYRSLRALNVDLTPEVRRALDRMVASDAAIAEAESESAVEPLFTTPESAGMSPEQFALYADVVGHASRKAREELDVRVLAEIHREQTDTWKRLKADIRAEVEREVYDLPVYRAISAMQFGTNPDGSEMVEGLITEPLKLSRQIILERYGVERLSGLPRPYIYSAEGGLDPDFVAEMFGFQSGDELLEQAAAATPMKRLIAGETDRRMQERHGSLLLDAGFVEAARTAAVNDERDVIIRAEIRALRELQRTVAPFVQAEAEAQAREREYERRWMEAETKLRIAIAIGRERVVIDKLQRDVEELHAQARGGPGVIRAGIPSPELLRESAREQIAGMKIRDIRPNVYWSAANRAADKALEAAATQDFNAAIAAKQQQLLNLALYREARTQLDEVERRVKQARSLATGPARARLGKAGEAYLDQVDGVLDRFEFARVSDKILNRRASLAEWAAALEAEGIPVDLPAELLNEARRVNYRELTVEMFTGVTDGLKQIVHLSRLKNRLLKAERGRQFDVVRQEILTSLRENASRVRPTPERDRRLSEEARRLREHWVASHRKLASLAREMDGFEDGGPVWKYVVRPLNEAANREATMNAAAATRFQIVVDASYPGNQKARLYEKIHVAAVGESLSKMQRIMIALNWGNVEGRQRILSYEKWSVEQVEAILDTLDVNDWKFVVGTWDFLDSFWPHIEAKERRVTGVPPKKVEALPIATRFGEFRGGYFPLKYDERLSASAGAKLDLEAANLAKQAAYVGATTRRGHTKNRVAKVTSPIRQDFGVIFEHVGAVIHDLSHHEALIDVGRIIGDKEIRQAIVDVHGDIAEKTIRDTVRDVAFGDIPARNGVERGLNHFRVGMTVARLGWSVTTAFLQPIGLTQSIVRIGPKWVALGLGKWLGDAVRLEHTVRRIREQSEFMANRGRTQQREINEIRNTLGIDTGRVGGWVDEALRKTSFGVVDRQTIADSFFRMIQTMQLVADVPTWLGAYEKAVAGGKEQAEAVALADQAVLDAQGGGQIKDLSSVQRGGPMLKIWTNFYSFFNTTVNLTIESKRRTKFTKPGQVGRLAVDYLMLYTVPATLGWMVRETFKGGDDDDDPAVALARENVAYLMGTMVGLRELTGIVQGYYGYQGPAGAGVFAAAGRLVQQSQQAIAAEGTEGLDEAFWKALNDTAGIVFHYPAGQVGRTVDGIAALSEGRTDNPLALVAGAPRND